ncbi:MAG: hypothetical protein JW849_11875 [Phycisphaerae bacterium]|nr:hypothetical protein [Phycisphaerae bacterium]
MATEGISAISSTNLRADFMNLLVTQMKYQNPLDPMKNEELTMQLATLSQLQATEEISTKFSTLLQNFELTEGGKLIGRVVEFIPDELGERISGLVSGATVKDGVVTLTVGPYSVKLDDVLGVWPYSGQSSPGEGEQTPTSLIGDVNLDNTVDQLDLEILQENYGLTTGATWMQGDLNGDGAVDSLDYTLLMDHFGESIETEGDSSSGEGDTEGGGDTEGDGTTNETE